MPRLRYISISIAFAFMLPGTAISQATSQSAEIKRLDFYVGRWSETGQMRDDPSKSFGAISGGETCRWAAGGSAVVCQEKTVGAGGGWEGVYIMSYDSAGKQYHVYGTEKPGVNIHAVGRLESDRWVWLTDPAPDGSRLRYTFTPAGGASRVLTVESGTGDRWSMIVSTKYMPRK